MRRSMPTEAELKNRITRHLQFRNSSDTVALLWSGYINALYEWGLINCSAMYQRIIDLLPVVGLEEQLEIFLEKPFKKIKSPYQDRVQAGLYKQKTIAHYYNKDIQDIYDQPTEPELTRRLIAQIEWRGPTKNVRLLWIGYHYGLCEWCGSDINISFVPALLPDNLGVYEEKEMMMDEPVNEEDIKEVQEYLQRNKQKDQELLQTLNNIHNAYQAKKKFFFWL